MNSSSPNVPYEGDFVEFVRSVPQLTVLTDHALESEQASAVFKHDLFDLRYKLGPIYDILRHEDPDESTGNRRTPMAILISGGWGTGKTSAMKWLEGLLKRWNEMRKHGQVQSGVTVHSVWFHPWKYDSREAVWRGLISELIIESAKKGSGWERAVEATKRFGVFLGKGFFHALASVKCKAQAGVEFDWACVKEMLAEYKGMAHPEKPYLNEFESTLKDWLGKTIQKNERMVVFIDDLDRCLPGVTLEVLEALKLYLDIPRLVFVVGMDKQIVEDIVVEHYRQLGLVRDQDRGGGEDEGKAKQYLSKMFQIEVELRPMQQQIGEFLHEQLESVPYWSDHLSAENNELFSRIILNLADCNPREIKRFLNSSLIVGVGSEMMRSAREQNGLWFAQGLQDFFIRRILYKRGKAAARMMGEDQFWWFLSDVSSIVLAHPELWGDETDHELWTQANQELQRKREYQRFLGLLHDKNLWALMRIPFSPELAELTSRVATQARSLASSETSHRDEKGTIRHVPNDQTIIDERIARNINKPLADITPAEYTDIDRLDLSYSEIGDLRSLSHLPRLQSLALFSCPQLTSIEPLSDLTHLQELDLRETDQRQSFLPFDDN